MQSHTDFEVLVVDGGSTDNTLTLIEGFKDPRIKVVSEKDDGLYDALNKGINRATGDIVGFLHSDDFFPNGAVLTNIAKAFNNENINGVYGNLKYVSADNPDKVLRNWVSKPFQGINLKYGWMPPHPTLFLKKTIYDELGGFNTQFKIAADYDFILKLFTRKEYKVYYLNIFITHMRVGGVSNKSVFSILLKSFEDIKIVRKQKQMNILTVLFKNTRKISQFIRR
jgi:glycosyltransferase